MRKNKCFYGQSSNLLHIFTIFVIITVFWHLFFKIPFYSVGSHKYLTSFGMAFGQSVSRLTCSLSKSGLSAPKKENQLFESPTSFKSTPIMEATKL